MLLALGSVLLGSHSLGDEFRALWVDAFHAGFKSAAEVSQLVADTRAGHFNALIVEVRKRGDAYYNSRFEPKATDIAAGYDPLADLITKAHTGAPRLEVHAWIVTYPIWNSSTPPSQPSHVFNLHPDWLMKNSAGQTSTDGKSFNVDPGHPDVQEHTFNVALDLISHYDIDGLHFDYVRYPGRDWGYNSVAVARFNRRYGRSGQPSATDSLWMQWRRDQVTSLVRKVYLSSLAIKPNVKVSAATITWAPGITTQAEWTGTAAYSNVLQDWRAWMQEGILDLNIPMAYFRQETHPDAWNQWSQFIKDYRYNRQAAIGAGIYLNTLSDALQQMRSTRLATPKGNRADGITGYSYAVPCKDAGRTAFLNALTKPSSYDPNPMPVFADTVVPPVMPWKTAPTLGHLNGLAVNGISGERLDAALVKLSGPVTRNGYTDANGWYGFVDLPPGSYTITAASGRLVPATNTIVIAAGVMGTRNFALYPLADDLFLTDVRVAPGGLGAVVRWATPVPAGSRVEFGPSESLGQVVSTGPILTTNHALLLTGLAPGSQYWFKVVSATDSREYRSSVRCFSTPGTHVVDNPSASYTGSWSTGSSAAGRYGSDYHYVSTTTGGATATATYTPNLVSPGAYEVSAWYPQGSNRSSAAPFQIVGDTGSALVYVNQTTGGGAWRVLAANRHFATGAGGFVRLSNGTGEAGKVVIADAVSWRYLTEQDTPSADGVPEWWIGAFSASETSGTADPDGDGYSNRVEYLLGTDPTQFGSRLAIAVDPPAGGRCTIRFLPCLIGRAYSLERAEGVGTLWQQVRDAEFRFQLSGEGSLTDLAPPESQAYYRLKVQFDQ